MISTADLHWAAGFLDGEGSFHVQKSRFQPVAQATQKDRWALEKLQRLFGGAIYRHKRRPGSGYSNRAMFVWMLQSRCAMGVMMTLYSLLSPYRQHQIEVCIAKWKQIPYRKDSPTKLWERYHVKRR